MDVNDLRVTLHSHAKVFLYEHYRKIRKIFGDVLGLMELDYISIVLLNNKNELFFLSSCPSIEYNLIEQNIWHKDSIFREDFFQKGKAQWWSDLYSDCCDEIYRYKQVIPNLMMGLSMPDLYDEYKVIYSFAFRSNKEHIKSNAEANIVNLINIGRFCLQNITKAVPLPDRKQILSAKKPDLKLITSRGGI
ncbi:flagellar biosynthesis protein FlgJ [Legionella sp. CNM-4043-24]|uniref:flagellar biosynthesis protein FlgJ n=1 Tax=Legionella sp. CNM-4043-24 TaxID=3421646 RepID=UPI00403AE817